MAEERVSSVIAESAFKEIEKLKLGLSELSANIVEINKSATGTDLKIASAKSISELSSLSKELGTATEQVKKLTKEQANYQKEIERQAKENEKRLLAIVKQDAAEAKAAEQAAKNAEKRANADEKAAARSAAAKEKAAQRAAAAKEKEAKADAKFQAQLEAMARKNEKLLTDVAAKEEAQIKNLSNDYGLLSKAYEETALRAKNYTLQLGANHPTTVQAIADAKAMDTKLKALDAAVGRHTRNVGNYNMVSMQMGQILRELPAAGNGFQTLVMALSNQMFGLTDAIKGMVAQGASTKDVLKSLGRSFLDIGNIITIAIAWYLIWGKELFNGSKAAQAAEAANKKYADSIKNIDESSRSSAMSEIAHIRTLESLATTTDKSTKATEAQARAVDELQRLYPQTLKNYDDEAIKAGKARDVINELTTAILHKAAAEAAEKKFGAASEKVYDLTIQQRDVTRELMQAEAALYRQRDGDAEERGISQFLDRTKISELKNDLKDINKALEAATQEQQQYLLDAQDSARKAGAAFIDEKADKKGKSGGAGVATTHKQLLDRINKANADFAKEQIERDMRTQESIINSEKASVDERIAARWLFHNGKVQLAEIEKKEQLEANKIEHDDTIKKVNSLKATEKQKNELILLETKRFKQKNLAIIEEFTTKENDAILDYADKSIKDQEDTDDKLTKAKLKNLKSIADFYKDTADARSNSQEEQNKKEEDAIRRRTELLRELGRAFMEVGQLISMTFEVQKEGVEREIDANDKRGEAEIKRIQNSSLTEEEKQEKIRASESKTAALRESLQQKEAQIRQRQAIFEKSIAVMQAIINTAVNVSKLVGNPPAAIAAGIAGAAQVAAIIAQPIPQYATGTLDHKGGKALFGEAGSELVLEPGGNAYMAHKPTVKNLPKGTQVWNQDMLHAMLTPQMVRVLNTKNDVSRDRALFGELREAIDRNGDKTVSAIKRNRAIQRVNISGNDNYYQRRVKGK